MKFFPALHPCFEAVPPPAAELLCPRPQPGCPQARVPDTSALVPHRTPCTVGAPVSINLSVSIAWPGWSLEHAVRLDQEPWQYH